MLVILPVLPVALIIFMAFGRITQPLFVKVQRKLSQLNTILQENLAGIKVVKAFAREPEQEARFADAADELMQQQIQVSRIFSFLFPFVFLMANLGQAGRALLRRASDHQGHADPRRVAEVQPLPRLRLLPAGPAGHDHLADVPGIARRRERIFEILDTQSEVADKPGRRRRCRQSRAT